MYTKKYKHEPATLLDALANISVDPFDVKFVMRIEHVSAVLRKEKTVKQVAEESGYSVRSIYGWVRSVDEQGWEALRSAPVLGRPPVLSAEEIAAVEQVVLGDPKEKGYNEWTGKTLSEYIRNTYHVEYGWSAATKLMERQGLRDVLNERAGRTTRRRRQEALSAEEVSQDEVNSEDQPPGCEEGIEAGGNARNGQRKHYTSDITREQYELIRPLLESVTKRECDLYEYFCGCLYIVTTGAQWENLPGDFPNHKTVYYYFSLWSMPGEDGISIFTKCLVKLRTLFRNNMGKKDKPTLGIVDAKSIKNADTAKEKGYDAGKKVSGIKLHIVVDTLGMPHALYTTRANKTDRDGAVEMVSLNLDALSDLEKCLFDGGYSGQPFADRIHEHLPDVTVEVVKRNELHTFSVLPKRWIVERSFGWLEKYRRLWKNCEKSLEISLQMTVLAFVSILLKRF